MPPDERLPPYDIEAEEAVVAAMLVDPAAVDAVLPILVPDDFFRERNALIYKAIVALRGRAEGVNQITVAHELARADELEVVGGQTYLREIIHNLPTSIGVEFYARIVKRVSTYRKIISASSAIMDMAYASPPDPAEVLFRSEMLIHDLQEEVGADGGPLSLGGVLDEYLSADPEEVAARGARAVHTGFHDLDLILGGMLPGDLVVVGARPGVGKSALAVGLTRSAALDFAQGVAFFSLEMSTQQLALRLLSAETCIPGPQFSPPAYDDYGRARLDLALQEIRAAHIWFDDSTPLTISSLRARVRRLKTNREVHLVIVDYLQLMQSDGNGRENREQEISRISRGLKLLAREFDLVVVALAQLSRAIEGRPVKTPLLSDLRDSGAIEQDADVVIFLSREEMHVTPEQWEKANPDLPPAHYPRGVARVDVAKHRNGPLGSCELRFNAPFARFENWVTAL